MHLPPVTNHESPVTDRRSLVLASRSPRRVELLRQAGFEVVCQPSGVEEISEIDGPPFSLAAANADAKALTVAAAHGESIVLGADTIVVLGGEIFGKPRDLAHAAEMLGRLAGRVHEVITAVSIVQWSTHAHVRFHEVTRVRFRPLGAAEIDAYLAAIDPLDKAGAYAAQDDDGRIIECVEGSFTNVVGLPMERTMEALRVSFGV